MISVLIIDDDPHIRKLIANQLTKKGMKTIQASNGEEALDQMEDEHVDLLVVDMMMPRMDGIEFTQYVRSVDSGIPILMVTAREDYISKKNSFSSGVDDYMTKPIDLEEMMLRISSLMRRAKIFSENKIEIGDVVLQYNELSVASPREVVVLPKKEFYLLYKLLSYPKQIFTRRQLMDEIWGMDSDADERTVDVHVKRLREKFEGYHEFSIVTIRGLGYKAERLE